MFTSAQNSERDPGFQLRRRLEAGDHEAPKTARYFLAIRREIDGIH